MSKKVNLLLGIHCHQPIDNFAWVIDGAVEACYQPFMEVVSKYPDFKYSIHYSGWLLEYIQKNHKKLFRMMQQAAEAGSAEFFTGGYYEPVLASIPSKDRIEQIKKLNKYIKRYFRQEPKGLWLTERVWDSSIIPDVVECGVEYVIVDDYHFYAVGFDESQMNGYYITEEGGIPTKIFPISKEMRYCTPFKTVDAVQNYLHTLQSDEVNHPAVIFDDGEKFGVWPGTAKWVYKEKWLEKFIQMCLEDEIIETTTYAEYVDQNPALGMAYLPTNSYYEMSEWSIDAKDAITIEKLNALTKNSELGEDATRFIKGGIWKNFFVKYHESNRLHKRMLELSRVRKEIKKKSFEDALFKAECNDVLWHGVFGGLYLPNLRDNAYRYVIEAENIRYEGIETEQVFIEDFNLDSFEEAKAVTDKYIALFDSKNGGQMTEFDLRDIGYNYQNTLTRRKESYHYKMEEAKEGGSEKISEEGIDTIHDMDFSKIEALREHLKFDSYLKNSFVDHLVDYAFNQDNFEWSNFNEYGDFAVSPYHVEMIKNNGIKLSRVGSVGGDADKRALLQKSIHFKKNKMDFSVDFKTACDYELQYLLEFNFHFADIEQVTIDGDKITRSFYKPEIKTVKIKDACLKKTLTFTFEEPCGLCGHKVDTVSQSEGGFDLTNQGLALGFVFPCKLGVSVSGSLSIGN